MQLLCDFAGITLPPLPPVPKDGGTQGNVLEALQEALELIQRPEESAAYRKEAAQNGLDLVLVLRQQRQCQLKQLQQENPRVVAALQKHLTADALNETVYLKKHKPPITPSRQTIATAGGGRNKPTADETEREDASLKPRESDGNAPEAPRV